MKIGPNTKRERIWAVIETAPSPPSAPLSPPLTVTLLFILPLLTNVVNVLIGRFIPESVMNLL